MLGMRLRTNDECGKILSDVIVADLKALSWREHRKLWETPVGKKVISAQDSNRVRYYCESMRLFHIRRLDELN
jgi:hypothetical protein